MHSLTQSTRARFGAPTQRGMVGARLLLIMCLALTVWAWRVATSDTATEARERFDFRKTEVISAIYARMAAYEQALRGALGLLRVSGEVTRAQWRAYVQTLSMQRDYPGIQGIGYSKWIPPADKAAYIAQIRAEGFSGFGIRPDGQRDSYASMPPMTSRDLCGRWRGASSFSSSATGVNSIVAPTCSWLTPSRGQSACRPSSVTS